MRNRRHRSSSGGEFNVVWHALQHRSRNDVEEYEDACVSVVAIADSAANP
jgi:hypothetical protein